MIVAVVGTEDIGHREVARAVVAEAVEVLVIVLVVRRGEEEPVLNADVTEVVAHETAAVHGDIACEVAAEGAAEDVELGAALYIAREASMPARAVSAGGDSAADGAVGDGGLPGAAHVARDAGSIVFAIADTNAAGNVEVADGGTADGIEGGAVAKDGVVVEREGVTIAVERAGEGMGHVAG